MATARKSARQARRDRTAAAKRTSTKTEADSERAEVTPPGDAETHQAHPETPSDSSVAHAPASGSKDAEGGYPSGEYDVVPPAKTAADKRKEEGTRPSDIIATGSDEPIKSDKANLLDAHFADVDIATLEKLIGEDRRIDDAELPLVLEALPVGAIIEHEAQNRWRVRSPASGGIRWGHGQTAIQSIESYVLGEAVLNAEDAAAQRFLKLSPRQQAEIEERDAVAAKRVGQEGAVNFAREEAKKAAAADKTADTPAANAVTDGPEKASARAEAETGAGPGKTASKAAKKSAAKRSGSKK